MLGDIRRYIAQDPIMEAAYRHGLPHWLRAGGVRAAEPDGAVRPRLHPDPRWGATDCRIVAETTPTLQDMDCTRLTLVLREVRRTSSGDRGSRRAASHLRVVHSAD